MQRFNNSIAVTLLGAAQIAFILGATVVGWALALMVAIAASVALAGSVSAASSTHSLS